MSELMELVDRLTVETRQILHTDAGPAVVRAAPLLEQLQEAVHPSGEGRGGSSGSVGSGAPLDVTALALLCQVKDEAIHLSWLARSTPGVLTVRPGLGGFTLAERIRWTAAALDGQAAEAEMLATVRGWTASIERLFDPPRVVALRGAECPACGIARTPVLNRDLDEFVDVPALTIVQGQTPRASCAECGAEWHGPEVVDLAVQLGAPPSVAHLLAG